MTPVTSGSLTSLVCRFLLQEESGDSFAPTALNSGVVSDLYTEMSLVENVSKSFSVCGFVFSYLGSASEGSSDSDVCLGGKVSDELTFLDSCEVSVIVGTSEISVLVDGTDVSPLGEFETLS